MAHHRATLSALLVVFSLRLLAQQAPAQAGRPVLRSVAAARSLLTGADFKYLGYYNVDQNAAPNTAQGFTIRHVNGETRFLTLTNGGALLELSIAGKAFGETIMTAARRWPSIGGLMDLRGLWMEEKKNRLWSSAATSYTPTIFPTQIFTRTVNDDLTISDLLGPISIETVAAKRAYGGVQPVPAWFQQQYHVGAYATGWGGGTSLITAGPASTGFAMYTFPDPASYASGTVIALKSPTSPNGLAQKLSEFQPIQQHRGVRLTIPINYMDGGDPRGANANFPPTTPPLPNAMWQSPRPDGKGSWTICDSFFNTGQWIETPTKFGFVAVLTAWSGRAYYMSSDNHADFQRFELHVFDPATLGEVASGARKTFDVEPASMTELSLPGLGTNPKQHMTAGGGIAGAAYDDATRRLYLFGLGIGANTPTSRIFVFEVAS